MKQVTRRLKNGRIKVVDIPTPAYGPPEVLVELRALRRHGRPGGPARARVDWLEQPVFTVPLAALALTQPEWRLGSAKEDLETEPSGLAVRYGLMGEGNGRALDAGQALALPGASST